MNIMLDVNIVLDVLQERHPHYAYSSIVLNEVLSKNIQGILPGHGITTIYYIVSKHDDPQKANESVDWLLEHFDVIATDKAILLRARTLLFSDFEDAIVAVLADVARCDFIVTRNEADFEHSPVVAISPEDFVKRYVFARRQENSS